MENLKETLMHTDQMAAVNKSMLDQQAQGISDHGDVEAEAKGLEKKLTEQKDSFATFDESLGLMTQEMREQCTGVLTNLEAEAAQLNSKEAGLNAKVDKLKAELEQAPRDLKARLERLVENEKAEIARAVAEIER